MLSAIMIVGWLFMYTQHFPKVFKTDKNQDNLQWSFYKLLAKEGYFFNIIKALKRKKNDL